MFCVWFLTLLPTVFGFPPKSTCVQEVPEFQYPCYVDVCTFPSQYCNQGERRCSPCTRYVCQQDRLPLACKYTCLKYDLVPSSMQNAEVTSASTKEMEGTPVHWLMIYSAIALTVLVSILLVILIVYCQKNRNRMSFKPPSNVDVVERANRTIKIEDQQRMRLLGPRNRDTPDIEELAIGGHISEHATNITLPKRRIHSTTNDYPVTAPNESVSNASNDQTFLKKRVNTSTCTSQTLETNLLNSAAVEPSVTHMFETEPGIHGTHSLLGTSSRQRFTSEEDDTGIDVMEARLLVEVHKDGNRAED